MSNEVKKISYGECIKRFRNIHSSDSVEISTADIVLKEHQHLYPKDDPATIQDDGKSDLLVIVCPDGANHDKYRLLTGWKDYCKAKKRGVSNIKAIIIPFAVKRYKFLNMLEKNMEGIWVKRSI